MKTLHIFNTLSRTVEEFRPLDPPNVSLYSCGPTVYLPQHLGNLRAYLCWDFLRRTLEFDGYRVRHVMNVTDVGHLTGDDDAGEDKIEKTARAEGKSPLEIANRYLELFNRDCHTLNIEPPTVQSRATGHIGEMIELIERIIASGYAYVTRSGVYFDIAQYRGPNSLGRLSRQTLDEQYSAQRLEHSPDKRNPHDFVLWVLNQPEHIMQWESPWGRGYPGWHIECSAMSMKYLGETIDIHSGGIDHIPIHHENEIAQSESATHKQFVRYFVHNAFLVGKEGMKISKSAGRFPLLADLPAAGFHPLAFRLFCFGAKYRSEIVFSDEAMHAAQTTLDYFFEFARNVPADAPVEAGEWTRAYVDKFGEALNDDLNTPRALAVARDLVAESYRSRDFGAWPALRALDAVLGLGLEERHKAARTSAMPADIQALIEERAAVRQARNFARADELRKEIESRGYDVKDNRDGSATYQRRSS